MYSGPSLIGLGTDLVASLSAKAYEEDVKRKVEELRNAPTNELQAFLDKYSFRKSGLRMRLRYFDGWNNYVKYDAIKKVLSERADVRDGKR